MFYIKSRGQYDEYIDVYKRQAQALGSDGAGQEDTVKESQDPGGNAGQGKEEGSGRQGMVFEIRVHGALREEKICHSICENDSRYYYRCV